MAPNLFQTVHAMVLPHPGRPIIDIENHQRRHGRHHSPAHNPAPIGVNGKPHAGKSRPGRHTGQINNPQPLRCRHDELAFHQIHRADFGDHGSANLAPGRPHRPQLPPSRPRMPLMGSYRHSNAGDSTCRQSARNRSMRRAALQARPTGYRSTQHLSADTHH